MTADEAGDHASVADWLARWGRLVAAVDFAGARALFDPAVVAFGTHMDVVEGLERLEADQWRSVWPTIADFRFDLASLSCRFSPDRLMALAVVTWGSTGFAADGTPFDRPGRATVGLERQAPGAPWRGIHTHLSLNRGVPQRSFEKRRVGKGA
jgi:ketosteroid isomerase-like protein